MSRAYLELDSVERLEKATGNVRDKLLIRSISPPWLPYIRISEALGITADEVDFGPGTTIIQHFKTRLDLSCPECG